MNIFSSHVVAVVILFAVTLADVALAGASDFTTIMTPIDGMDINQIVTIVIDLSCDGDDSAPNTMFTIFPSNNGSGVSIETSPPNLITAIADFSEYKGGSGLSFEWNTNVASTATSGGVRIGVPPNQLKQVVVVGGHNTQILDGFTSIDYLSVIDDSIHNVTPKGGGFTDFIKTNIKTSSIIRASMMSLSNDNPLGLKLNNFGGQMYVETNVPVDFCWVRYGGQSWVKTPSFHSFNIDNNGSQLNIKGDLGVGPYGRRSVQHGAQLTVTGTITGLIIENKDNSTVNAPSCDNIDNGEASTCNAGPQNVDVDVGDLSQKSQILTGTYKCGEDSSTSPDSDSEASSVMPGYVAVIVAFATAAVATAATMIWWVRKSSARNM